MSSVALAPSPEELAAAPEGRIVSVSRVRGMGIFLMLLALVMAGPLALSVPSGSKATFLLSAPPAVGVAPLTMSVRSVNLALALVCFALGCVLIVRTRGRGSYLIFGLGVVLFIWALLTWAARGGTLNFVDNALNRASATIHARAVVRSCSCRARCALSASTTGSDRCKVRLLPAVLSSERRTP